jgi:hypothetical protein
VLATGLPFSVMPLRIRQGLDVVIAPVTGWKGMVPTWFGIPCSIGRIQMSLLVEETPGLMREFSLLTLFPRAELTGAPPYIFLGIQFFHEYRGQIAIDGAPGGTGKLIIP